ncbi:MAG: ERF family protein [Spirochaetia bacterium]
MTLVEIQKSLHVKKNGDAVRYKYRTIEDIYAQLKPMLNENLKIDTKITEIGHGVILTATVAYGESSSSAHVKVNLEPKGMGVEQAFGSATTYAVRYALCNLFLIDNGEDVDKEQPKSTKGGVHGEVLKEQPKGLKAELNELMNAKEMSDEEKREFWEKHKDEPHLLGKFELLYRVWRGSHVQNS